MALVRAGAGVWVFHTGRTSSKLGGWHLLQTAAILYLGTGRFLGAGKHKATASRLLRPTCCPPWCRETAQARPSLPGPGATASLGGRGQLSLALKAASAAGGPLTTMAPRNLPLALGLALLTLCLLVLPQDARARHKLGGFQTLSPGDPQVVKVVQVAMADYNKGSNSLYYFRDTDTLKAQRQVWPGMRVLRGKRDAQLVSG